MADSLTAVFRGICIEDLKAQTTTAQVNQTVLGIGTVPLTPFVAAANDSTAVTAGLSQGEVYINNASVPYALKAIGGIQFSQLVSSFTLAATTATSIATITVTGALLGDCVLAGASIALPIGVQLVCKVTAANTVLMELWNLSGSTQALVAFYVTGQVLHP